MKIHSTARAFAVLDLEPGEKHIFRSLLSDVAVMLGGEDELDALSGEPEDTAPEAGETGEREVSADDLARLVGISTAERPEDPAVLRLLPDVDGDDAERSAEFRRLTEHDLRESKLANIRIALYDLSLTGRIELDEAHTRAWSMALNDVRLVLATRMSMASESDVEDLYAREAADELDDQQATMLTVYDFLTWAQERLTTILLSGLGSGAEDEEEDA
ncbi:DUF2017 family protein [Brevibacterium luteolum]|uniref:DUF2017 family protein n=1 Tax=Brevibacterium luteolum TaxID=199591 RepID=A0A6G8KWJ7_9MICO|nr:DUF2017 family protein [Brevibacterium luteolum]MCT1658250.1 DUF2017 domain-containing protein [Brevibacterium luteolum]MCT1922754.1 DUF2017 domain-containing protein [Brevibacterium luteolum]QIN28955.1 DUF2017 family protein [Brevibacterium luteolum]